MSQDAALPVKELRISTERTPTEATVSCSGRLTSDTTDLLKTTVRRFIPDSKRIVVNLSDVHHIDSSGIGALVTLWVTTKKSNCELKYTNVSDHIKSMLRVTNLSKTLHTD
jgi:anti-anti-sigma factor